MKVESPARDEGTGAPADSAGSPTRPRSRRLLSAGAAVTAVGAAGAGATIPSLASDPDALTYMAAGGFAAVAVVGAGLIQRGRSARVESPFGNEVDTSTPEVPLPPPPHTALIASAIPFAAPLPPPLRGEVGDRSPLPMRVPDDASVLTGDHAGPDTPAVVAEPEVASADPDAVEEPGTLDVSFLTPLLPDAVITTTVGVEASEAETVIVDAPLVPAREPAVDAPLVPNTDRAMTSVSSLVNDIGNRVLDQYRNWVLEQAIGDRAFRALDIDANLRDLFMLSSCGVATMLAWLHEQHGATYTVDTWIDEILPSQGIEIDDRELAIELLIAAALYAGGIHTAPTARLREYRSDELVTAMATMHVGLLRLYCGIGRSHPATIVGQQFDGTPFAN